MWDGLVVVCILNCEGNDCSDLLIISCPKQHVFHSGFNMLCTGGGSENRCWRSHGGVRRPKFWWWPWWCGDVEAVMVVFVVVMQWCEEVTVLRGVLRVWWGGSLGCVVVVMWLRRTRVSGSGKCCSEPPFLLHHCFSFTTEMNTFSLSQATAFLWYGLWFCFKPASLPVFCCWMSSSSRFMFVLLLVSWWGWLAA